tara:strand:- start:1431 stop:2522 length:1092 start_codon:yes stop_codon:yes gene_type:complete
MPFPLVAVLIGAGIGAMAGGMSGEDGWDWNKALMGGVLGGATGGIGAGALGGAAAVGAGAGAGATGAAGGAAASSAAGLASTSAPGLAALGSATAATAAPAAGAAIPSGLSGLSYGMGPQALASSGAQTGFAGGITNTPLMHSYGRLPNAGTVPVSYGKYGPTTKAGFAQNEALMKEATGGFDYGKLGETMQSFGEEPQEAERDPAFGPPPALAPVNPSSDSIAEDLLRERQAIQNAIPGSGEVGLRDVETAARGGIATKFGMMKTPSGSLTGGEIVGPGTGTSDTIRSAIYPDLASKIGSSSMQNLQGGGHQVQKAALSDGEFVVTAKAVEGLGKDANAPPGQEREYGSKLLDMAMNQWQRT